MSCLFVPIFTVYSIGTDIDGESAVQFATATSSSISLHNLSIASLQADYNTFLESGELAGIVQHLHNNYYMQ